MTYRTIVRCCAVLAFVITVVTVQRLHAQDRARERQPPREPSRAAARPNDAEKAGDAAQSSAAAVAQYRAAAAFQNKQQYDFAVEEWQRFHEKFPDDPLAPKARHYAGVCYLQLKQYDQAIDAFGKVIRQFPKFELIEAAYLNLGLSYYAAAQAGKTELHDKAAETFDELIERFPNSGQLAQAWFYRGEALYARGKKEDAVRSYQQLVEKYKTAGQRPDALYAVGVAQHELGRFDDAARALDTFLKDYGKHPLATEVLMRKGDALLAGKKYAEAEKHLASAAKARDFKLADYATLRYALALYEQKKYAEAANVYASLVQDFPKSQYAAAATLSAGNCYYLSGMQKEARTWLSRAVQAGGENAVEAAHWLARSYLKDKQPEQALETVERVLPSAGQSAQLALLRMDQADALYDLPQRRREAATKYAELAKSFPESTVAAQAGYMAAFASLGLGEFAAARDHAEAFLKTHGEHTLRPDVQFVLAEALIQLGEPGEADRLFAELLAKHGNHADAEQWLVRRALCLFLEKKYEAVINYLRPLVARLKQPDLMAEAQFLLGNSHFEQKQYREASSSYQASLKAQPKWRQADEALLNLSRAHRALDDVENAKLTVQELLKRFPQSNVLDRAHFRLGEYHYASGDYEDAAAEHRWVIEKTPQSPLVPHALYGLGWALLSQQKYDDAERAFSELIEKHKDDSLVAKAYNARANARVQKKDFDGAAADANAFLKAGGGGAEGSDARFVLGLSFAGQKKYDEAIRAFGSILEDDPQYAGTDKVLFELAWAHKSAGNDAEAVDYFAKLTDDFANSPLAAESFYHVGEHAYHQEKEYRGAIEAYQLAIKRAGKSELGEKAQHKLAWAHYQLGDFAAAQKAFQQQLGDYPAGELTADAAFMNAESLFKQNQFEAAYRAFERSLALRPSSDDFLTLGLLHAGQSAAQLKRWDDSLRYLTRLTAEFPDSPHVPEALYEQGWAKQNQRKLDEAINLYEQAAEKAPTREVGARARFMVGEVLFDQGKHKDAVRNFFLVAYGFSDTNAPESIRVWQANSLYESARCFEVLKNVDQAKKLYAELLDKYPKSDKADLARQRLTKLSQG